LVLRREIKVDVDSIDFAPLVLHGGELIMSHTDAARHTAEDHTQNRIIELHLAEEREPNAVIFGFKLETSLR